MDEFARYLALERHLLDRLSTRVVPFDHGTMYLDEDFPQRYHSNFLLVEGNLDKVRAEALVDAAERLLGGAGYAHRLIYVPDQRVGESLALGFRNNGYTLERYVIMIHRREADRPAGLEVQEVSFADVKPFLVETYRDAPLVGTDAVAHSLSDQHGKLEKAIGARFFAVRIDRTLAGACELYVEGPDAQVENVNTLAKFRGRGIARAVVLNAVQSARAAGARHVFIAGDDGDWPKDLYRRLGFDDVGRTMAFVRWP